MAEHKKHSKGHEHSEPSSAGPHQRSSQAAIHKPGQFPRPLENPVEAEEWYKVKPGGPKRLDGISASRSLHHDNMDFIDANQPIYEADEIREKQVQGRYGQRFLGEFRVQCDRDDFRDQRRDAQ